MQVIQHRKTVNKLKTPSFNHWLVPSGYKFKQLLVLHIHVFSILQLQKWHPIGELQKFLRMVSKMLSCKHIETEWSVFWSRVCFLFRRCPLLACSRLCPRIKRGSLRWLWLRRFCLSELILPINEPVTRLWINQSKSTRSNLTVKYVIMMLGYMLCS